MNENLPGPGQASASGRLKAIDVFRGATIVAMILVNAQLAGRDAYPPFKHAAWNGLTFADTIYPCFLFLVGISVTLSTASRVDRGAGKARLAGHAVRRTLLLVACGVFIDNWRFPYRSFPFFAFREHLQLTGVLQRIGLAYLAAFLVYLFGGRRGAILGFYAVNALYAGLLFFYVVPGCGAGSLGPDCNFAGHLNDVMMGGYLWDAPAQDPEGPGAVLPAIGTVLLGIVAGELMRKDRRPERRAAGLLGASIALIAAGVLLGRWLPVNKILWTPSYQLVTGGLAAAFLAAWIWLVDVRQWGDRFSVLEVFGLNAVAAYLISVPAANVLLIRVSGRALYPDLLARVVSPPDASLLYAVAVLFVVYGAVWFMHRRRWYLKF